MLDALEGSLDVFVGVAEGDGAAVGAGGGMFGFAEFGEEPVDFCGVEGLDAIIIGLATRFGGYAAAAGFGVFALLVAVGEPVYQAVIVIDIVSPLVVRGGFDGEGARAE